MQFRTRLQIHCRKQAIFGTTAIPLGLLWCCSYTKRRVREESGGNPLPLPHDKPPTPPPPVIKGRAPLGPRWERHMTSHAQKRQKCIWGSKNPQIRRTRMKKSRLVILGAPRCSKVLKVHFGAFGPSNVARRPMKTHFFKK